jgi:hypothetical protein
MNIKYIGYLALDIALILSSPQNQKILPRLRSYQRSRGPQSKPINLRFESR